MHEKLQHLWRILRQLSGDDAYERYLAHFANHAHDESCAAAQVPLTKAEFFRQWQDAKWQGIKRCC